MLTPEEKQNLVMKESLSPYQNLVNKIGGKQIKQEVNRHFGASILFVCHRFNFGFRMD